MSLPFKEGFVFADVLAFIADNYEYEATAFKNGDLNNAATENQGSCKVFSYAQLNNFSKDDTLQLFAEHYRNVLENPEADNHQNIRNFIKYGWDGISFEKAALKPVH